MTKNDKFIDLLVQIRYNINGSKQKNTKELISKVKLKE